MSKFFKQSASVGIMRFLEVNMDFETKQDLIDFVREQFGVVLENDETHPLNQHPVNQI